MARVAVVVSGTAWSKQYRIPRPEADSVPEYQPGVGPRPEHSLGAPPTHLNTKQTNKQTNKKPKASTLPNIILPGSRNIQMPKYPVMWEMRPSPVGQCAGRRASADSQWAYSSAFILPVSRYGQAPWPLCASDFFLLMKSVLKMDLKHWTQLLNSSIYLNCHKMLVICSLKQRNLVCVCVSQGLYPQIQKHKADYLIPEPHLPSEVLFSKLSNLPWER